MPNSMPGDEAPQDMEGGNKEIGRNMKSREL